MKGTPVATDPTHCVTTLTCVGAYLILGKNERVPLDGIIKGG